MENENNSDDDSICIEYTHDLEKQYELPLSVINALKPVFNSLHPTQLVYELCTKLKEPFPQYSYSGDDNYKFKCTANLNFGSICVAGYNDQKKEAKKIASEMFVMDMIKKKKYRSKIIQILIKDYHVSPNVFEFKMKRKSIDKEMEQKYNEENNKPLIKIDGIKINNNSFENKEENDERNKIINNKRDREEKTNALLDLLKEKPQSHSYPNVYQPDRGNKGKINIEMKSIPSNIKTETQIQSDNKINDNNYTNVNISTDLFNSNNKPLLQVLKKSETETLMNHSESKSEQTQSTLLNFELFCLKWERSLLLDKATITLLSKFMQNISLIILKLKTRMNIHDSFAIGSYHSSSIRLNFLVIDYLIVLNNSGQSHHNENQSVQSDDNAFEMFIEYSNPDITKHDYKIDLKKNKDVCCLEITSKEDIKCIVQFAQIENTKQSTDHLDYLSKASFTIEQEIALKLIKAWRRSKGLLYLNPIIIEFIILNIGKPLVNQIVISFYESVTNLDEESFSQDYQKELIGNLKLSTNYPKLIEEVNKALEVIKSNSFCDLF